MSQVESLTERIAREAADERAAKSPFSAPPGGAIRRLWGCRDPEILVEGPAGTGKTRGVMEKLNFCAMKYARARILVVRATRVSMNETVLQVFEEHVLPRASPLKQGMLRKTRDKYTYPNGAEMVIGGLDNPLRIMSAEYDLIYMAEGVECTLEQYELLLTRLRSPVMPYRQAIVDCNPGPPMHWLNLRADKPDPKHPGRNMMTRIRTRHEDNPTLYDHRTQQWTEAGQEYVFRRLASLTGARLKRMRYGLWVAAEGAVYEDEWDAAVHVIPEAPDPRRIAYHFVSLDWGYTNPGVSHLWAVDKDGIMYCIEERYHTGLTILGSDTDNKRPWGRYLADVCRRYKVECIIYDPSEPEHADSLDQAIGRVHLKKANNDLQGGIDHVRKRLKVQPNGKARLYFVEGCQVDRDEDLVLDDKPYNTIIEFTMYRYPPEDPEKPVKEDPVKMHDHGMDSVRYAVMYADFRGNMGDVGPVQRTRPRPRKRRPSVEPLPGPPVTGKKKKRRFS